MLLLSFFFGIAVFAQNVSVRGTVSDASTGEGIPFASVIVRGTMTGVSSDGNGVYELSVPSNGTLEFSAVGYVTVAEVVNGRGVINVQLKPDSQFLDEVVVTAMGISREKKALGYAVQDLKSDKLSQAASASLSSAIQGKVSGVEISASSGMPGASSKITIRGARSLDGNNQPLYVVDGMATP